MSDKLKQLAIGTQALIDRLDAAEEKNREYYLKKGKPSASMSERQKAYDLSRDLRPNVSEAERQKSKKLAETGYNDAKA